MSAPRGCVMTDVPPKKDRTESYLDLEASSPTFLLKQRILERALARVLPLPARRSWDAGSGAGT